jgi:hypothetical protein
VRSLFARRSSQPARVPSVVVKSSTAR